MKNDFFKLMAIAFAFAISINMNAQCPAGETEVTIQFTDGGSFPNEIQWDYIAGGFISGLGPFLVTDVVTACVPDGNLLIVGCDTFGDGWNDAEYVVTITEDGSINGCGAQDGCVLYIASIADGDAVTSCADSPTGEPVMPAGPTLTVGPCDASPILAEGCTDPAATNYNACATTDDGTCLVPTANDDCANAIPLLIEATGDCPANEFYVNNISNTMDIIPSCGTPLADLYYTFTVPPTGNVQISAVTISGGTVQATIYDACGGAEIYCNTAINGESIIGLTPGANLILQLSQSTSGEFNLCVTEPPPPPTNDLCVDAIRLCGDPITATNASSFTEPSDPLTTCIGSLENTVWFSFVAAGGGPVTVDIIEGICSDFTPGMQTHILSGPCGGPFLEEDCTNVFTSGTTYTLNLLTAVPGDTYYVYIDGVAGASCTFDINVSGDFQPCCGPDFSLSPACQLGDSDNFYVDIQVNDIGDNPSGYSVNGGAFSDITTTGTVTIGPFPNGTANIVFEGLDDPSCVISRDVDFDCSCDPLAVTAIDDGVVCPGDAFELSATLEEVIPGGFLGTYTVTANPPGSCTATPDGAITDVVLSDDDFQGPFPLGFNFDFWGNIYTDFYISSNGYVTFGQGSTDLGDDPIPDIATPNDYIALFWDDLNPSGAGTVSYYDATVNGQTCLVVDFQGIEHFGGGETITGQIIICPDGTVIINCIDCQTDGGTDVATSGIENADGTAGAFDPALTAGQFTVGGSYIACTTFVPDVAVPSTCDFVYWVTDLSDPVGSTIFSGNVATVNPTVTTTYYAVVECENGIQCVDEVTVTMDDPVNCGTTCEDEIAGQIIAPFDCDLIGITVIISIINADGSETIVGNATTDASGNYALPGGPFACGNYSAMLMLPLPDCYADAGGNTGPVGPINFSVNGDGVADGANFAVNAEVPTLSQWGLMILALLMMSLGAIKLLFDKRFIKQIELS